MGGFRFHFAWFRKAKKAILLLLLTSTFLFRFEARRDRSFFASFYELRSKSNLNLLVRTLIWFWEVCWLYNNYSPVQDEEVLLLQPVEGPEHLLQKVSLCYPLQLLRWWRHPIFGLQNLAGMKRLVDSAYEDKTLSISWINVSLKLLTLKNNKMTKRTTDVPVAVATAV
jgi:hypothetical protein